MVGTIFLLLIFFTGLAVWSCVIVGIAYAVMDRLIGGDEIG